MNQTNAINTTLRILLILPDARIHKLKIGSFQRSMREAPLTLTVLAALIPAELNAQIRIIDENVQKIPEGIHADIVGISVLTGTSERAYELARQFRNQGSHVVIGGVHATLLPEEASLHADTVITGSAELTWPQFLRDFKRGEVSRIYSESEKSSPEISSPLPRRDLQSSFRYNVPDTVFATRGCRHACGFCTVPALSRSFLKRPVSEVIDDIKSIDNRLIVFNDVDLASDREYAKEIFSAMIPLKKKWGGLVTFQAGRDAELLDLMEKSGCSYLLIGFESVHSESLKEIKKGFNKTEDYREFMKKMHERRISIQGCFIFGFDFEDTGVFQETLDLVNESKIDIPRYSLLTPYPGTDLFKKLEIENRIVSYDWKNYDTMHSVFTPRKMSREELTSGFKKIYEDTFRMSNIKKRITTYDFNGIINIVGNLTYKKFAARLRSDPFYSLPPKSGRIQNREVPCLM
ncbi:MAG: B12-binding domain-containing radical SAM protein [Spirochaetia bacterium]|nr:B12-binding domain-containing radical SAM protein [Spirochaetia bacterium]